MHIDWKRIYSIIFRVFFLFFLGGMTILMYHYELRQIFKRDTSNTSLEEGANELSAYDILNGNGGYLDICIHAPKVVTIPDIDLYCDKSGDCYFFLPSGTPLREYVIRYDESCYQMTIDNVPLHTGDKLDQYMINTEYPLVINNISDADFNMDTMSHTISFMQSDNLPAVFISTVTGSIDEVNLSKEYKEAGRFVCQNADGSIDSQGFLDYIKGHGNSSYDEVEKKSFQIAFGTATDVLSMGSANKYILQANAFDDTYLRNKIVYEYCKDLQMQYVVDAEYVDLYFNGEYAGNYLLCEKVEFGDNRIDVSSGYLIEKILHDRIEDSDQIFQVTGMGDFLIKNSVPVSEAELESVTEYMNTIEELIKDCDSYEKYENLQEYIDIESFVDMYLINAITNDIDSNLASTFYYKMSDKEGGKLYAGPVWDYDNAWGRAERGYVIDLNAYPTGYCEELFSIEYFRDAVTEKYNSIASPLMQVYLADSIPQLIEWITPSIAMDAVRWQDNGYHSPNYVSYGESVSYLNDYIRARLEYLDDRLNNPEKYHYILFVNTERGGVYRDTEYWIEDGEYIPDEVMEEVKIHFHCEQFRLENEKDFDNLNPILRDMVIYSN